MKRKIFKSPIFVSILGLLPIIINPLLLSSISSSDVFINTLEQLAIVNASSATIGIILCFIGLILELFALYLSFISSNKEKVKPIAGAIIAIILIAFYSFTLVTLFKSISDECSSDNVYFCQD